MNDDHRTIVRIANLIRDQVIAQPAQRLAAISADERQLGSTMQRYLSLCRKAGLAVSRHWHLAASQMIQQADAVLRDLRYEIDSRHRLQVPAQAQVATLSDIARDLDQLETEFHEWDYDEKTQDLSVRTEDIELEGMSLGAFEVKLHLSRLVRPDPVASYSIIALDPNPASGRDGITHPHVSDERLCPGDATSPIRAALEAGRICDFFLLVRSVLQTYNAHSAYVPLDSWNGLPCHDCGDTMNDDEGFCCQSCDENFCESCSSYCHHCDTAGCLSCLESCPECEDRFCSDCTKACSECGGKCCVDCLTDELCPSCHEKK